MEGEKSGGEAMGTGGVGVASAATMDAHLDFE